MMEATIDYIPLDDGLSRHETKHPIINFGERMESCSIS